MPATDFIVFGTALMLARTWATGNMFMFVLHVVPPIEADNKTRIVSEGALPG
eukprot:COSAG01_NODE_15759_length_1302_cov_5.370740_1_plen_51_part_10